MSGYGAALASQRRGRGGYGFYIDDDIALDGSVCGERPRVVKRVGRLTQPTAADAVSPLTCAGCGLLGKHAAAGDCIAALRDRLARYE